jgi:hypothetical protein
LRISLVLGSQRLQAAQRPFARPDVVDQIRQDNEIKFLLQYAEIMTVRYENSSSGWEIWRVSQFLVKNPRQHPVKAEGRLANFLVHSRVPESSALVLHRSYKLCQSLIISLTPSPPGIHLRAMHPNNHIVSSGMNQITIFLLSRFAFFF